MEYFDADYSEEIVKNVKRCLKIYFITKKF